MTTEPGLPIGQDSDIPTSLTTDAGQSSIESAHAIETSPSPHESAEIENIPPKTWVTLGLFAIFVIAFGTCASTYLFR